jgi:hypothetical protein
VAKSELAQDYYLLKIIEEIYHKTDFSDEDIQHIAKNKKVIFCIHLTSLLRELLFISFIFFQENVQINPKAKKSV